MTKENQPKRHHYVPQGYLRGFADQKEHIQVVPLDPSENTRRPHVKNVALFNNFHTTPEVPDDPVWFEKELSQVEGKAVDVIRRIEGGKFPLRPQDRADMALFIALQAVRGPDTRNNTDEMLRNILRIEIGLGGRENIGRWIERKVGRTPTPELEDALWREVNDPHGLQFKRPNYMHIFHAVELAEHLWPYIYLRSWQVVRFERRSLLTCDAPVSLVPRNDHEPWRGVGFENAQAVAFPLTRKIGLLMMEALPHLDHIPLLRGLQTDEERLEWLRSQVSSGCMDHEIPGTTALANLFNAQAVGGALRYVYHHPDDGLIVPDDLPEPRLITVEMSPYPGGPFGEEPPFGYWAHEGSGEASES